tara:strand:+ start:378 stop:626 length:249 start_codon:yes stop_codon:yes gene_type:complete
MESKWGNIETQSNFLGENSVIKIAGAQMVLLLIMFILLKPSFITCQETSTSSPQISIIKLLIVVITIVIATYFVPPLITNNP